MEIFTVRKFEFVESVLIKLAAWDGLLLEKQEFLSLPRNLAHFQGSQWFIVLSTRARRFFLTGV
jgi:hypothetical protein